MVTFTIGVTTYSVSENSITITSGISVPGNVIVVKIITVSYR